MTKSISWPVSSAPRSARQSAWSGVITLAAACWAATAGALPLARTRPRRPFRRSAGLRSSRPAWTASPRMVISSARAPSATERAYGRPRALVREVMARSHFSISSKVSDPICRPWNSGRIWASARYLYFARVVGSMSSSIPAQMSSILQQDSRSRPVPPGAAHLLCYLGDSVRVGFFRVVMEDSAVSLVLKSPDIPSAMDCDLRARASVSALARPRASLGVTRCAKP